MTTKIYTKKGDAGMTNLYDSRGVPKSENIFDALGDLDELACHIGHLCSLIHTNPVLGFRKDNGEVFTVVADRDTGMALGENAESEIHKDLRWIQVCLLNIGSDISTKDTSKHLTKDNDVELLEERTDYYNEQCRRLTEFILLGSAPSDSIAHICRAVSRRAERNMWRSTSAHPIPENCFKFINRLSSFFFALARYMAGDNEVTRSMYVR
jgi:cob(I)alamin adenosyltransferase